MVVKVMAKYRKKPVVIEAVQWNGNNEHEIVTTLVGDSGDYYFTPGGQLFIHTLEGQMKADIGDYIIKGIKGEFYPCKPDIFEATYEKVE